MSTRLRLVYSHAGVLDGGGTARLHLESWYEKYVGPPPKRGSMPEHARLVQMYKKLPASVRGDLWLFREPRGIPRSRSRWKQLADYWHISPRKQKKLLKFVRGATPNVRPPRPTVPGVARPRTRAVQPTQSGRQQLFWEPPRVAGRIWDPEQGVWRFAANNGSGIPAEGNGPTLTNPLGGLGATTAPTFTWNTAAGITEIFGNQQEAELRIREAAIAGTERGNREDDGSW